MLALRNFLQFLVFDWTLSVVKFMILRSWIWPLFDPGAIRLNGQKHTSFHWTTPQGHDFLSNRVQGMNFVEFRLYSDVTVALANQCASGNLCVTIFKNLCAPVEIQDMNG